MCDILSPSSLWFLSFFFCFALVVNDFCALLSQEDFQNLHTNHVVRTYSDYKIKKKKKKICEQSSKRSNVECTNNMKRRLLWQVFFDLDISINKSLLINKKFLHKSNWNWMTGGEWQKCEWKWIKRVISSKFMLN